MEYALIIGNDVDLKKLNLAGKYLIGIDKGAYQAINAGLKLDMAIGDFDSVNLQMEQLIKSSTKIVKLPPNKNETDTAASLKYCKDATKITIVGGIQGKRIEHFLANISLMHKNRLIEMIDDNSYIYTRASSFSLIKNDYRFISFFAIDEVMISLEGFAYPLKNYLLKADDTLTISNELVKDIGEVDIKYGRVLVIQSKLD